MAITLNLTTFRANFNEFSDPIKYPDATIQLYWDTAILYISNGNYGILNGNARERAIQLFTAHLLKLEDTIASGEISNLVSSAGIGGESVSLVPPPVRTQFQWWLSTTVYGQQLYALLQIKAVGGIYVGGLPEGSAFRKSGGIF